MVAEGIRWDICPAAPLPGSVCPVALAARGAAVREGSEGPPSVPLSVAPPDLNHGRESFALSWPVFVFSHYDLLLFLLVCFSFLPRVSKRSW